MRVHERVRCAEAPGRAAAGRTINRTDGLEERRRERTAVGRCKSAWLLPVACGIPICRAGHAMWGDKFCTGVGDPRKRLCSLRKRKRGGGGEKRREFCVSAAPDRRMGSWDLLYCAWPLVCGSDRAADDGRWPSSACKVAI